jgi:hypothetical protein
MALWGNRDSFSITGTVDVVNGSSTVTGTSTAFLTELNIGDNITISTTKYKVTAIASNTELTISPAWSTANASGETITGQDTPKYLLPADGRKTFGVDTTEADANDRDAGWILRNTYTDMHGNTRDKREVLVAMSSVTSDAEDVVYPDAIITIVTQPVANTANSGDPASFSVVVDVDPVGATLTYVWQEDDGGGFANISNGGVYSGANTETLAIANNAGLDTYEYRVVVSSNGASSVTSDAAVLNEV